LITISSEVAGRLVMLVVEEGQHIKKGDLLAQIQQDEYQAQVALHSAALEAAQSQLASAEADLALTRTLAEGQIQRSDAVLGTSRSQLAEAEKAAKLEEQRTLANLREKEASVEEARARLTGAKAALDKALADRDRAKQLASDGIVAAERLDQTVAAYDSAVAQQQSAQEMLNRALALVQMAQAEGRRVQLSLDQVQTQQNKVRESQVLKELAIAERQRIKMKADIVNNLRAKVKEVEAQLSLARLRLTETTITSPIDGVVSQTIADAGERVQPGQPIVVVNDPRDVWISANIEETHIRKVRDGQPVTITVDAYPHQTFYGTVTQLGAATRSEFALIPAGSASAHFIKVTQRLPVRIAVENPDGLLKPGMMVEVGIRVQ
jgi:membrane fusion protein (multidrug efflux system)